MSSQTQSSVTVHAQIVTAIPISIDRAADHRSKLGLVGLSFLTLWMIAGCGAGGTYVQGPALHGQMQVGKTVIPGAVLRMYAASSMGTGSSAMEIGEAPIIVGGEGAFTIPARYRCPSASSQVFLVGKGSSPNLPNAVKNNGFALMSALGACGNLDATASISLSEETTAAAVLSLAPYMKSSTEVGSAVEDAHLLSAAFVAAKALVTVGDTTPKAGATKINESGAMWQLAKLIGYCSPSTANDVAASTACRTFFADGTRSGQIQPEDTVSAALAKVLSASSTAGVDTQSASVTTLTTASSALLNASQTAQRQPALATGAAAKDLGLANNLPLGSVFVPPSPNACGSAYDRQYMAEPGVYAYWGLCEAGANPFIHDYVGRFDLTWATGAWSSLNGTIHGGVSGPVPDGETADQVTTGSSYIASMNIPLNGRQGTMAAWVKTESTTWPTAMMFFGAVNGKSALTLSAITPATDECFVGTLANTEGTSFSTSQACGYQPNTWHRVAMTWLNGKLSIYVDGLARASGTYTGKVDDKVFVYRLFPQSGDTGKQMTLAKASLANQAWTATQINADYKPVLIAPPAGGVYVTGQKLGTIHEDVLGYADINSNISNKQATQALTSGLMKAGIRSVRYASGAAGITADLADWRGGNSCTAQPGATTASPNATTQNVLTTFVPQVANKVGASLGYTVNYGTNPPFCNAGGDPVVNGANLVEYANLKNHYGVKYWEIGNELYNGGGSETDFHPQPGNGTSYAFYESQFYNAMKGKDSTIKIGIPVADGVYSWLADWSLPAMVNAKYDAVVFHNYPIQSAVTDGDTLYGDRVAANLGRVRGSLLALQTELLNVGKSPEAIWITEWNADAQANGSNAWSRQTLGAAMPMFAAIQLAEYMQVGVQYATWYGQGSPNACWSWNYDWTGQTTYSWNSYCGGPFLTYTSIVPNEVEVGLNPGDLTPAARAFQVFSQSKFVSEGEHMVRVVSDPNSPWLTAYAATHGSSYAVLLINRDRDTSHTVPVRLAGEVGGSTVTQWTYGRAQYDLIRSGTWSADPVTTTTSAPWRQSFTATVPPWSISVLVFNGSSVVPSEGR